MVKVLVSEMNLTQLFLSKYPICNRLQMFPNVCFYFHSKEHCVIITCATICIVLKNICYNLLLAYGFINRQYRGKSDL